MILKPSKTFGMTERTFTSILTLLVVIAILGGLGYLISKPSIGFTSGGGVLLGFFVKNLLDKSHLEISRAISNKPELVIDDDINTLVLRNAGNGLATSIKFNFYMHIDSKTVISLLDTPFSFEDFIETGKTKSMDKSRIIEMIENHKSKFLADVNSCPRKKPFYSGTKKQAVSRWSLVFNYKDIWGTDYFSVYRYEKSCIDQKSRWAFHRTFIGNYLTDLAGIPNTGYDALSDQKDHLFIKFEGFVNKKEYKLYSEKEMWELFGFEKDPIEFLKRTLST